MIVLHGNNSFGLDIKCPSCHGLLWINLHWVGLPQWTAASDGSLDRYFKCAWCNSILAMAENNVLNLIDVGHSISKISSNDIIVIHEYNLVELLLKLLMSRVQSRPNGSIAIGGIFNNIEDLRIWCNTTVNAISQTNVLLRIPVIDI